MDRQWWGWAWLSHVHICLNEEHRQIKLFATLSGQTIREFVLESVRARMHREQEAREVSALTKHLNTDPVLKAIWENERDAAYDRL